MPSAAAQLTREHRTSAMQTRAHGANRAANCRRRVEIAQLVEVAQYNGFAISHRQRDDGAPQRLDVTSSFDIADRICVDGQRTVARRRLILERERWPDRARAADVIAGDAEEPEASGRLSRPVPYGAVHDGDERFVDDVFGGGRRTAHVRGKPADGGAMAAIELGKRLSVARGDAGDKKIVRPLVGAHVLYSAVGG